MSSLAVLDFDRTIVDADSDQTIIDVVKEIVPTQECEANSHDWTPYMNHILKLACKAGMRRDDILDPIACMKPTLGMENLICRLSNKGWDVVIISDANSVFVNHWLHTHGLTDYVATVITNPACWYNDRLCIEPCMNQTDCQDCPTNLCKSIALEHYCKHNNPFCRVVYIGDGRNDYCPATILPASATVFARRCYPLDEMLQKTLRSCQPEVKAKVVSWDHCHTIVDEIFHNDKNII